MSNIVASRYNIVNDIVPSLEGMNEVDGVYENLNNKMEKILDDSGEPIRVYLRLRPMSKLE